MTEVEIYKEDDIFKSTDAENIFISSWVDFKVDLSSFTNLRRARLSNKNRKGLGSCHDLQELIISKVHTGRDDLSKLRKLVLLDISEGNISNLDFLKDMPSLKTLKLSYLYKLKDVTGLLFVKDTLEYLEIDSCKNIDWNGELVLLKNLRKLILGGFKFEDIKWIKELSSLQHLSLVDSNVLNGDISPAENIHYVGIDNKRHYNYKFDDSLMKIVPK
jgi:hypothetical protein